MKKLLLNSAKTLRLVGLVILAGAFTITQTGCSTEGCTEATATNFDDKADDDDGSCIFERDAIIGSYNNSTDGCLPGESFNMTVTAGPGSTNQISISNFGGFGSAVSVNATVTGSSISLQSGSLGAGSSLLSGSGSISGSLLTINYTYDDQGGDQFTCTINATKSN